jgi:hypothetical protein
MSRAMHEAAPVSIGRHRNRNQRRIVTHLKKMQSVAKTPQLYWGNHSSSLHLEIPYRTERTSVSPLGYFEPHHTL